MATGAMTRLIAYQPRTTSTTRSAYAASRSTPFLRNPLLSSPRAVGRESPLRSAAADDSAAAVAFVSADAVRRGDVARAWISSLYDAVDYGAAMETAEALEAEPGYDGDEDEDGELMYGEFDMGFFLALLDSLEDDLAALERSDDATDEGGDRRRRGVFVDVGSGRGQLALLAAAARPWSRCVGLEYMPILHGIAEQIRVSSGASANSGPPEASLSSSSSSSSDDDDETSSSAAEDPQQTPSSEEVLAALPRAFELSPLTFMRGDMYADEDMARALKDAALVFMFSTRFGVDGVDADGSGVERAAEVGGAEQAEHEHTRAGEDEGEGGSWVVGRLKVSSVLRRHVATGTLVVTVNNALRETDGFELLRRRTGPDSERTEGSTAYVWVAV